MNYCVCAVHFVSLFKLASGVLAGNIGVVLWNEWLRCMRYYDIIGVVARRRIYEREPTPGGNCCVQDIYSVLPLSRSRIINSACKSREGDAGY